MSELADELNRLADTEFARVTLIVRFNPPTGELDWKPMDAQTTLADKLREAAAALSRAEAALEWRPIETLGFGVEEQIIVVTDCGSAWIEDCDKDMDGEWIRRAGAKHAEHIGVVSHWRLLGDVPVRLSSAPLDDSER